MNFLKGKVESHNRVAVRNGDTSVSWAVAADISSSYGNAGVVVGVRPENFKASTDANDSGIRTEIEVVEFLGEEKILTLNFEDTTLKAIVPVRLPAKEGDFLWLNASPEDVRIFDEKNGEALLKAKE